MLSSQTLPSVLWRNISLKYSAPELVEEVYREGVPCRFLCDAAGSSSSRTGIR